ncbi:MAG: 50S ribosomal protein L24 [Patescibacteria group bacterium]
MHVKKGDNIIVLAGKDKGKSGKILRALPSENKVLVEGVNMKKVHERSKKGKGKGQIIEKSFPIHVSNVKLAK